MELFSFAERISEINFGDIVLRYIPHERLIILSIDRRNLNACNPTIGFYDPCIRHQRFSNVAEYLYYSLMYKSPDPIENDLIRLDVRDLDAKHKSIASFVDRLHSIFELPKFCITLRLEPMSCSITGRVIERYDAIYVTMRFNYLNRIITKLYTDPNTTIKILAYLILLR